MKTNQNFDVSPGPGHQYPMAVMFAKWAEEIFNDDTTADPAVCVRTFETTFTPREFHPEGWTVRLASNWTYHTHGASESFWLADGEGRHMVVSGSTKGGSLNVNMTSPHGVDDAVKLLEEMIAKCPKPQSRDDQIPVRFWTWDGHNADCRFRLLRVQTWDEIERNYTAGVQSEVTKLASWSGPPAESGHLMLLHGPPGTGKTHLIRMLGREWAQWCEVHYIVEPEKFWANGDYMMEVMLTDETDQRKWRLIVIEDAEELISENAKDKTGQALARLLNTCDGIIGQGLQVIVLITTNAKIERLHPAVVRSGRCMANIEVGKLTRREAENWLGRPVEHEMSVAELYELNRAGENQQLNVREAKAVPGHYV